MFFEGMKQIPVDKHGNDDFKIHSNELYYNTSIHLEPTDSWTMKQRKIYQEQQYPTYNLQIMIFNTNANQIIQAVEFSIKTQMYNLDFINNL